MCSNLSAWQENVLLLQLQQQIKEEEQLEQLSSHYPGPGPDYYYHRDYVHHDPGHIDKDLETRCGIASNISLVKNDDDHCSSVRLKIRRSAVDCPIYSIRRRKLSRNFVLTPLPLTLFTAGPA